MDAFSVAFWQSQNATENASISPFDLLCGEAAL
jgi:hypothetical protein